jgi:hypothetical protein
MADPDAEFPEASFDCKHFKAFRDETGQVDLAVEIPTNTLHESSTDGVATIECKDIVTFERSTKDPTQISIIYTYEEEEFEALYTFPDPQTRQLFYQSMLPCNPFGADTPGDKSEVKIVPIFVCSVDTNQPVPDASTLKLTDSKHDVYIFMLSGDGREAWYEMLQDYFGDTHEHRSELASISPDVSHDLVAFTSTDIAYTLSNCNNNVDAGGETEASSAITFWIGETSFGIYASDADEYEDSYIGSWHLDLHQFRHFIALGSGAKTSIPLSGAELAKDTCGTQGEFMWRSSPDLFEGTLFLKSSGQLPFGNYCSLKGGAIVPILPKPQSSVTSNYVLIIDNLRASGVTTEGEDEDSDPPAVYVYMGGQFCEDRRTTAKTGTATPVWQLERQIGGQTQNSIEVLQLPTYVSDISYLMSQRLMVAVMDQTKGEEDPMIGYGFLGLKKCCLELDTAHEFVLDLTFFMSTQCSLTGRVSVHSMESETRVDTSMTQDDKGENRKIIQGYFRRYDLDESGTINSNEEMQQLCTNLSVRLELKFSVSDIDQKVTSAGDMAANEWDCDQFIEWFSKEFSVEVV